MIDYVTDTSKLVYIESDNTPKMTMVDLNKDIFQITTDENNKASKRVTKALIDRAFYRVVEFNSDIVFYSLTKTYAYELFLENVLNSDIRSRFIYGSEVFTFYEPGYDISEKCPTGTVEFAKLDDRVSVRGKTDIFLDSLYNISVMVHLPVVYFARDHLLSTRLNVTVGSHKAVQQRWVKTIRDVARGNSGLYVV